MTNQQLIIVGFMGSGKTTVARKVARRLNRPLIDLDELITTSTGRSSAEIIQQDGEPSFREIETRLLGEALRENPTAVLAVGGGAWTIPENRALISKVRAQTVWLDAPFELCWKRIQSNEEMRPLAPTVEAAAQLYENRRPVYELADLRITIVDSDSIDEIAASIVSLVRQSQNGEP
ncbi:MAG TPA: shikimate kinase [Pyrinomonadaceae bacterium]|jgi:shikimate kinase